MEASVFKRMTMSESTKAKGDGAEARALRHLQAQGLTLVERNYRVARGPHARAAEVDLILRDAHGTLVFVEVGSRGTSHHGAATETVTRRKQQRIVWAARHYLMQLASEPPCRFDVVALQGDKEDKEDRLEWLQGAFDASTG